MILSIIIPTFNSESFIIRCIKSIYKNINFDKYEIIVVDNNSSDNTISVLNNKNYVKLVANKKNLGYSKAVNIGLKIATGDYICILNPDTIIRRDAFRILIDYLKDNNKVGCVGPKILNTDGTFQFSCRRNFPYIRYLLPKFFLLDKNFPHSRILNSYNLAGISTNEIWHVNSISGAFMMLPRGVVAKVGKFDERFFMFWEDTDYCNRVFNSGYLVSYNNNAEIVHYKGGSREISNLDLNVIFYKSLLYFFKKYQNEYFPWKYFNFFPILGINLIIVFTKIKFYFNNLFINNRLAGNE